MRHEERFSGYLLGGGSRSLGRAFHQADKLLGDVFYIQTCPMKCRVNETTGQQLRDGGDPTAFSSLRCLQNQPHSPHA